MKRALLLLALGLRVVSLPLPAQAAPEALALRTAPPLVAGRLPVPNVILVLDADVLAPGRRRELVLALREAFGRLANGQIRLAWQAASMCEQLPDPGSLCQGRNGLKLLDDEHRSDFAAFLDALEQAPPVPPASSDALVQQAREHLGGLGPGTRLEPMLGCRKAFVLRVARAAGQKDIAGEPPFIRTAAIRDANAGPALQQALDTILAESQTLPTQVISSLSASSRTATPDATLFAARYDAERWSGEIAARRWAPMRPRRGACGPAARWPTPAPACSTSPRRMRASFFPAKAAQRNGAASPGAGTN